MNERLIRVLVVEDDDDDFVLLRDLLPSAMPATQIGVERATSVSAAIPRISEPFDVFLFDFRLGEQTGLDLLRLVRRQDIQVPVILLTGQGDEAIAVEAIKAGAMDYLPKSKLSETSLRLAVRSALNAHAKEQLLNRARRELRANEERFRALIENSSDVMSLLDRDGTVIYSSHSLRNTLGYEPSENIGTKIFERIHPDDLGLALQALESCMVEPGVPIMSEIRMRHRNGSWQVMEGTICNRLDEPAVRAIVVNGRDITERKRTDEALRRSEQEYRTLFESANDAIMIFEPDGEIILEVNQRACEAYGFSRQALIGHSLKSLSQDCERGRQQIELVLREGSGRNFETIHYRSDGMPIHFLANSVVIDYRGQKAILTINRDITERKRAEQQLRASEERYRQLFERNLAGVFSVTLEGTFLECNQALRRILGYGPDENVHGVDLARFWPDFDARTQFLRSLMQQGQLVNRELEIVRMDGKSITVLVSVGLLRDKFGKPYGASGTILDVTETRRLHEQLLQAQKMEAVGQLAGGVAHDFNNLLLVITSYSELLANSLSDPLQQRHAEQILKASHRAADLTRQLLTFSRKQVVELRVIDLNAIVREMGRMLPRVIGENIRVELNLASDLGSARADPSQIQQVLMNLTVNARDAMPNGGCLTVETANVDLDASFGSGHLAIEPGRYVQLAVSDTGIGIEPAIQQRIFEPFFTTKEFGKGTGLGLSTVYGIVQQSKGQVFVYSEPGHGTTFKVYLPRVEAVCDRLEETDTGGQILGNETILLVEDEEDVREAAAEFLQTHGYRVLTARNGEEALTLASQTEGGIDLLLTDVIMPGPFAGPELARRFVEQWPQARVLYMSGYTENAAVQQGIWDHSAQFLQKPFSFNLLGRKVREALDNSQLSATAS